MNRFMVTRESLATARYGLRALVFPAYDVRRLGRRGYGSPGVTLTAQWSLTHEALGQLLERLGTDPATAGREYLALRDRLVDYFAWRGTHRPDVAADETLDRAARRLEEGET